MSGSGSVEIYRDSDVHITKTLIRVGQKSYPINGIGSVDIKKPNRGVAFVFAVIALIIGGIMLSGQALGTAILFLLIAAVALMVGLGKPYFLILRTASGDQQALSSKKVAYLVKIKEAIEMAVSERG